MFLMRASSLPSIAGTGDVSSGHRVRCRRRTPLDVSFRHSASQPLLFDRPAGGHSGGGQRPIRPPNTFTAQ
jgi:hypothetical protein